jgi:hypothetical protein
MERWRRVLALFVPLLVILLIGSSAKAGNLDPVEGIHFTVLSETTEGGSAVRTVRIDRQIPDTPRFASQFRTDMFRIRTENPTVTLALCHEGGKYTRARVRPDFIEADRASNAYWDSNCPEETNQYVYLIPGERITMTMDAGLENLGSVPAVAAAPSAARDTGAASDMDADAGMAEAPSASDPIVAQLNACTTRACVWNIVSPLAPNVQWTGPATAVADPLATQIKACDTQRCVLDLVIPVADQGISWRDVIASKSVVANQATGTATATDVSSAPSAAPVVATTVIHQSDAGEVELRDQLRTANAQFHGAIILALALFALLVVVIWRNRALNTRIRELKAVQDGNVEELRQTVRLREEAIEDIAQRSAEAEGRAARANAQVAALELEVHQLSMAHRAALAHATKEGTRIASELRSEAEAERRMVAARDAITLHAVERLCARFGLEDVASTEDRLNRLDRVIGRLEEMLKQGWSSASIEAVRLDPDRSYALEDLLTHALNALPHLERILASHRAAASELRGEVLALKSGARDPSLLTGLRRFVERNGSTERVVLGSPEDQEAIQEFVALIFRGNSQLMVADPETGEMAETWIDLPRDTKVPSVRPPSPSEPSRHLRAVKT